MQKLLFIFILAAICTIVTHSFRPTYSSHPYVKQVTYASKKNVNIKAYTKATSIHESIIPEKYYLEGLYLPLLFHNYENIEVEP